VGLDVGAVFAVRGNTFEAFERIEVMVAWEQSGNKRPRRPSLNVYMRPA
jgi:hypothetical protein